MNQLAQIQPTKIPAKAIDANTATADMPEFVSTLHDEQTELKIRSDKVVFYGMLTVSIALGTFLAWAIFVPLKEAVVSQGTVVLESNRKTIQHFEGGIIHKIHIREGDAVKKDDILIELDQTQSEANHDLIKARYLGELATLDRLHSEIGEKKKVTYSDELKNASNRKDVISLIEDQDNLFFARREQMSGRINLLTKKKQQLSEQISGLRAQRKAMQEEIFLIKDELGRMQILHKENLVDGGDIIARKREISRLNGEIGRIAANIAELRVAISEAEQEINQVRRENQSRLSEEMVAAQQSFFETREQLIANDDKLRRTIIRAPIDGVVFNLKFHTEGGVIPPGEGLMEIIPGDDLLVIEAKIQLQDIDNVFPGKPVRLRFSAFKSRVIPELQGEVRNVSGDTIFEQATGLTFYKAIITTNENEISKLDKNKIIPGMLVDVSIEGNERTAMDYFLDPITEVVEKSLVEE